MALNKGIGEPEPGVTNIKGTNLKSLSLGLRGQEQLFTDLQVI